MKPVFTNRNSNEGKVGIGVLPSILLPPLSNIVQEYYPLILDKRATTYHTYYADLIGNIKTGFDTIQSDPFWHGICDDSPNCIMKPVFEMNELYYSNPKPDFHQTNLYGAAANLVPHRDCVLFYFSGIRFYRILIGLTDNNNDTITEFIHFKQEHKINKGDYMIFDFDKTSHQVKKTGSKETPRILMKLHFIVCENCAYDVSYVDFVAYFYKYYYFIARYTEQIGTDPTTFMGFFFGILWEYPLNSLSMICPTNNTVLPIIKYFLPVGAVFYLRSFFYTKKTIWNRLGYFMVDMSVLYLMIVSFFYFRFQFFGIK